MSPTREDAFAVFWVGVPSGSPAVVQWSHHDGAAGRDWAHEMQQATATAGSLDAAHDLPQGVPDRTLPACQSVEGVDGPACSQVLEEPALS
jgi:hypothetical protein